LLKSTAIVGFLTLISRVLGLIRDLIIARTFGVDAATDAFFVAFRIPNLLRRLFAEGSFSQALVPALADHRASHGEQATKSFLGRIAGALFLWSLAMTILGVLTAPALVLIFAPGFYSDAVQYARAVAMLRITFPYLFFISLTAFASGVLHAWERFAVPAFTPALLNLAMIAAAIWLAPRLEEPVAALAWGVLGAGILQLGFQIPALAHAGLLPRIRWGFRDPEVRRILYRMGPTIFAVSAMQINLLLNTLMASFLISGSVSWLYYSDRLVELPVGLLGVAIGTAILPHLANHHAMRNCQGFSRALDWALRWAVLVGLPATIGLVFLASPLVSTLFQHNEFSAHDAEMASRSLSAYALGLLGFITVKVLASGFNSRHDVVTPVRYALYAVLINAILSPVLALTLAPTGWAHVGLALSTALAALFNALLLLGKLIRDGFYRPAPDWSRFLGRVLLASLALAFLLHAASASPWYGWHPSERIGYLAFCIGAGVSLYGSCLWLMGIRPRHLLLHEPA
jgi:putative peptidoglycan lipid II flippase